MTHMITTVKTTTRFLGYIYALFLELERILNNLLLRSCSPKQKRDERVELIRRNISI